MNRIFIILSFFLLVLLHNSCKKKGCTDQCANNYQEKAKENDGTCTYDNAKVSFYTNGFSHGQIIISVIQPGDTFIASNTIDMALGFVPACESAGTVTISRPKGSYRIFALGTGDSYEWNYFNYEFDPCGCKVFLLPD